MIVVDIKKQGVHLWPFIESVMYFIVHYDDNHNAWYNMMVRRMLYDGSYVTYTNNIDL